MARGKKNQSVTPTDLLLRFDADRLILEQVQELIESGADVNAADSSGNTPLHYAARKRLNPLGYVKALLAAGAEPNVRGGWGMTPLHHAVGSGKSNLVRLLLEAGAEPAVADANGATALHRATGSPAIVELLLAQGADPTARTASGKTVLDLARQEGHLDAVALLQAATPTEARRSPAQQTVALAADEATRLARAFPQSGFWGEHWLEDLARLSRRQIFELAWPHIELALHRCVKQRDGQVQSRAARAAWHAFDAALESSYGASTKPARRRQQRKTSGTAKSASRKKAASCKKAASRKKTTPRAKKRTPRG